MRQFVRILPFSFYYLVTVLVSIASESLDLSRFKPVADSEQIPIVDFCRRPLLRSPSLSPLGTHIAAEVTNNDDKYQLFVYEIATGKSEMVGGSGDKDIYEFTWLNNTRLMFSLSSQKLRGIGLFAADINRLSRAYPLLQYSGAHLVAVPKGQPTFPLVWARAEIDESGQRDGGVFEIDSSVHAGSFIDLTSADTPSSAIIEVRDDNEKHIKTRYPVPPVGVTTGYFADKDGSLAYAKTSDNGISSLYEWTGEKWLKCPINLDETIILTCGDDRGEIVVLGPRQEGKPRAVQYMQAATGRLGSVILQDASYDFGGWFYRDPLSRHIVGAVYDRTGPQVTWFSDDYKKIQKLLEAFFPGMLVRILGSDESKNLLLVETRSDRQPSIYSWVNLKSRSAGLIKNSAPWVNPNRMQPMSITKFKTRDGYLLDAYITMPAGVTKQNPPPLVVFPHGGPWIRDTWGFNSVVQFLAGRGYAVLQPNYRGSLGYGWKFPPEDDWDFKKMHDDVTDACRAIVSSGLVDGERVAILGGSFGGYLALSGVVNEPALYRCAITMSGVFDWEAIIKGAKNNQYASPIYSELIRRLGDPKKQIEKFDLISPVRHVAKVRVPVLVAHGLEDTVVDVSESKRLISELEKYKIPHESFLVAGEGHGMAHLKNKVELFRRIENFLATNLMTKKSIGTTE